MTRSGVIRAGLFAALLLTLPCVVACGDDDGGSNNANVNDNGNANSNANANDNGNGNANTNGGDNERPVADAGGARSVLNRVLLTVSGSATDLEGDAIVDWRWEVTSTPAGGENYQLQDEHSAEARFTPQTKGDYTLSLQASDAGGWGVADVITVHAENNPPVADAGADQTVVNTQTAVLTGSGSDLDGDALSYQWSVVGTPGNADFDLVDANLAVASFTPRTKGTYLLELIVSDGDDASLPAQVTVVAGNNPPVVDVGADLQILDPTATPLVATVDDPDGDTLSLVWQIVSTAPPGLTGSFSDPSALTPTFTPDQAGTYQLALTATDDEDASHMDQLVATVYAPPAEDAYVYLALHGADNGGICGSRSAPCRNLSTAVRVAAAAAKNIAMAAGDYTTIVPSVDVPPGVSIYGGYDPTTWMRDIPGNPTILRPAPAVTTPETGAQLTDGRDNDCDGYIDTPTCIPSAETCDNRDNDCDGLFDHLDPSYSGGACGDTLEPNETDSTPSSIELGTRLVGLQIGSGDTDWFTFVASALPPATEAWTLTVHLACTLSCSSSQPIDVALYRDGTTGAHLVTDGQTQYVSTSDASLRIDLPAGSAQPGTYYVRVSSADGSPATYQLDVALWAPDVDPTSDHHYDRVAPYCRDAHVLGIEGAKPAWQPGDENVISGLTIHGRPDAMKTSLPNEHLMNNSGTHAPRKWGAVLFCNGCALTLEDSALIESQLQRRDLAQNDDGASAPLVVMDARTHPVRIRRNYFQVGYTRLAAGLALHNLDFFEIQDNRFDGSDAAMDPHVDDIRLLWSQLQDYGTDTLTIDANHFELDCSPSQTGCYGIFSEEIYYLSAHPLAPLHITNNIFVHPGGATTHNSPVLLWTTSASSGRHPDTLILNNSFYGAGQGTAIRPHDTHHGTAWIAVVNNYIEGFEYGFYTGWAMNNYFANNIFHDTPTCAYNNYNVYDCGGANCGDCIALNYRASDDSWISEDNGVAQCLVVDAAAGDYHPVAGSPCIDSGDQSHIPAPFPGLPAWMDHDRDGATRPVDDPSASCPAGTTCDLSDVGAYEYQP